MNDSAIKDIANEQTPLYTALRGFINSTNYINIGVISKVHDENYVDVNLYYTDSTGRKVVIQAVRLLHIGTTKCKINIVPAVGDNVLLICPKDFIEKLEYNRVPAEGGVCYIPYGNINMCAILIKDEADDNVKTTIKIDENGALYLETEGEISVKTKENATLESEKDVVVTAKNITAMCESFSVKKDENGNKIFEVTP